MALPLVSPAPMFVTPLVLYELSALDSVEYDDVSDVSVDAELENSTTPADEPDALRLSCDAMLRTNERTPLASPDIEPLPSSTNDTSTRVWH